MKIFVNGDPQTITTEQLSKALIELGFADKAIATALNGSFISAAHRDDTMLNENDQLEVVSPQQGG